MMFYLPRLFWTSMEEGKLTALICGVTAAEKKEEKAEDKDEDGIIVDNVLNYLHMKEGGHWQYGVCYVASQVRCLNDANV